MKEGANLLLEAGPGVVLERWGTFDLQRGLEAEIISGEEDVDLAQVELMIRRRQAPNF